MRVRTRVLSPHSVCSGALTLLLGTVLLCLLFVLCGQVAQGHRARAGEGVQGPAQTGHQVRPHCCSQTRDSTRYGAHAPVARVVGRLLHDDLRKVNWSGADVVYASAVSERGTLHRLLGSV